MASRTSERQYSFYNQAIYGLKQSGRQWYKRLNQALKSLGFNTTCADSCFYVKHEDSSIMIVAIYVDDILIATNNDNYMQDLKQSLMKTFKMKDLGPLKYCLGIDFEQDVKGNRIFMSQKNIY